MKKIISFLLALLLCTSIFPMSVFAEKDPIYDLSLDAQGIYVYNLETGTAIYEKAENARMFPASTTKIVTALIVLENCKNPKKEIIKIESTDPFNYIIEEGGVHMELSRGETFTVYDLLVGLMMSSYCDVAELLAIRFGGSTENFVKMMNDKAKEMGLENTHFENAHGLHHPNHYSSPKEIALLLEEALKNDVFREILSLRNYTIPATDSHDARSLRHTVSIFYENSDMYLDCFVGGKSGFTNQAGRCLAAYSEKDGVSYISVLLGANMDSTQKYPGNMAFAGTNTLISYAYEHFSLQTVLKKGEVIKNIVVTDSDKTLPVIAGEDVVTLVRDKAQASYEVDLPKEISATELEKNKEIGKIQLSFNGEIADGSYPLLLSWDGTPIATKSAIEKGAESAANAVSGIFKGDKVFVTLFILLLLVIFICLPAIRFSAFLHKKKIHKPKH
ncbi:MAG: D-alanyl-D-alanine carboxypeptidase [Clostridia bacterium]|nr:D-alanyl-D-alanine carboxypeptidase [Clostridia bacterium]